MTSTSVHIEGTANDPAVQARTRLAHRNDELLAKACAKSAVLTGLRLEPHERYAAQLDLTDFCTGPLLSYLRAVDHALYAPAAGATPTRLLVRALRIHHSVITDDIHALEIAADPDRADEAARRIVTTLGVCLDIETSVLLPALSELPGADLTLLAEDLETVLSGEELAKPTEIDVRDIPHGQRHPRIFGGYARLSPGESFVLINNHDPKPLRREFDATFPGQFAWDYLESGPTLWRIRIGKPIPLTANTA